MRGFIACLAVILVLMIAFVTYFFVGGTLSAEPTVVSVPASQQADAFAAAKSVVEGGVAPQRFSNAEIGNADGYRLIDVTISLKNIGVFAAEWLEIDVSPAQGDVAVYSVTGDGTDVASFTRSQANLKLLTAAGENARRTVTVSYYVLGMRRSVRITV